MPRKSNILCLICGHPISGPAPGQKYHLGPCRKIAKKLLNIKSKLKEAIKVIDVSLDI